MKYDKQSRSPYAKYRKTPHRYSDTYIRWARAAQDHGLLSEECMAADRAFREKWGLPAAGKPRNFAEDLLT